MNATTDTYTPEFLSRWKLPPCYAGARWPEYYVAPVTRNRDSDHGTESNWAAQWDTLRPLSQDTPDGEESSPRIARENHWAVGWVEWVAIHESNVEALREADRLAERLESHPLLDDEDAAKRELEDYESQWGERWVRREWSGILRDMFGLRDCVADKLEDGDPYKLMEAFEALIPSGEYFTPNGSGVSVCLDVAKQNLDWMEPAPARAWMANLLRTLRKP